MFRMFVMENVMVEPNLMVNVSTTGRCNSQSRWDGEVTGKMQEGFLLSVENGSAEEIPANTDDGSYYVTWTVFVALAVPRGADVPEAPEKPKKTKKESPAAPVKALKAQSCYHIEFMLPGDAETINVDLVVYGPVAKMCKEDELKILRTWREGDQTWVGWTQTFSIGVNRDVIISHFLQKKIKLQVWNGKDRLCSLARCERLRALRPTQDLQPEDAADMCGGVKTMVNKLRRLCGEKSNKKSHSDVIFDSNSEVEAEFQKHKIDAFDLEDMKKNDTVSVEISPVCFLAGEMLRAERFPVCSSGVFEVMCGLSLDRPLISDELEAELNPLVITIESATSLPSSPVPFHTLQENCVPVYCQYKFHNLSMHRTNYHKPGANVYFRDSNVVMTGLMLPEELREFLSGPPLEIEIHDRDRKSEETGESAAEFGRETKVIHSFGVAHLNLSELLLGKKRLKTRLPIRCCPLPPLQDGERSVQNNKAAASRAPMPQGHYLGANSQLKVKVELARPFSAEKLSSETESYDAPFGRIVYLYDYSNVSVTTRLRSEILRINASALRSGSRTQEDIEEALADRVMNLERGWREDLDVVTGFHVLDRRTNIVILEGLKHKAVRTLWEAVPMKLSGSKREQVRVLYNSELAFFKRIYDSLHVGLSPVRLSEPLEAIMEQPLVYVRGTVPQTCFQALSRLSHLCQARQLRDAVRNNLFPSAAMILSLSEVYGAEPWQQNGGADPEVDAPRLPVRTKRRAPLDARNREYRKQVLRQERKDFIGDNIRRVKEESERLQKPEAAVLRAEESEAGLAHNYSIQTLNSTGRAQELLRAEMAKHPGRRFTYSQQYLGATLEPGDATSERDFDSAVWVTSTTGGGPGGHPEQPDEARVEELRKPWRENVLHANTLKPTLSRDTWPSSQHHEDFHIYSRPPPLFSPTPVSIHLAGDLLWREQLEAARGQYSRWLRKLLPGGGAKRPGGGPIPEFKCHVGGNSGRSQDVLKDEPEKFSLKKPGMMLKPLPYLSVLNLDDGTEEEKKGVALAPGDCMDCSLSSRNNAIPRHASLYSKYHYPRFIKQRSLLYKRTAPPLTDEEKSIFTFQKYQPNVMMHRSTVQPFRNIIEARTHENCTFYIK